MNLTIGTTALEIMSCTRMRDVQRGFYLDIKIPKGTVTMDELEKLFDGNKETIFVSSDTEDNMYNGFEQLYSLSLENNTYTIIQVCTSELEAQLSIVQSKMAAQEKELAAVTATCAMQEERFAEQTETSAELLYQVCLLQLGISEEDL